MKVLLVSLGAKFDRDAVNFWKACLGDKGLLLVLRIWGIEHDTWSREHVHSLEQILFSTEYRRWPKKAIEITFRNSERVRGLTTQFDRPCSILLWKTVVRFHSRALACDLQSFDVDLIDLRWIPRSVSFTTRLMHELQNVTVLSGGQGKVSRLPNELPRIYDSNAQVSIILPVYNGAKYIHDSISSCLNQSHKNLQLIIVDDCSTDDTPAIVGECAKTDDRILSIRNSTNLHLPGALNVGFRAATGEFLSWTSHDNCYSLDAIEELVTELCSAPKVGLVYSAFRHMDETGRVDPRIVYLPPPESLPFVNCVGPCFLYRRVVYETIGEYSEKAEYQEDYEYWLRVAKRFKLTRLHLPLYYYRRHAESMTAMRREHPGIVGPLRLP
jgi:hypothetical protein